MFLFRIKTYYLMIMLFSVGIVWILVWNIYAKVSTANTVQIIDRMADDELDYNHALEKLVSTK